MTHDETMQLHRELCSRWKGKFSRPDLDLWARELSAYALPDVVEALTKFRNASRFVPKVAEIVKMLPRPIGPASEVQEEPSFAEVLRRQNQQWRGRPDAEVYVRYYRGLWHAYSGRVVGKDAMRRKLTSECVISLQVCGWSEAEAVRAAEFLFAEPEMFRALLSDIRVRDTPDPFARSESTEEHVFA